MKIYRIVAGDAEVLAYAQTRDAAIIRMVEYAQADKSDGLRYWEYTFYHIEALEFGAAGTADEDDWSTVLKCEDLTDIFPAPRKNSDGVYEDEYDYEDDD